jgi:phosphatidate cytidylyltransferase
MLPVLYFMIGCAVVGAIGMALTNRNADAVTSRQRWIKYFVYILLTAIITLAIIYKLFFVIAIIIVVAGLYEMMKALQFFKARSFSFNTISLTVYGFIAAGFLLFSYHFNTYFQFAIYLQVLMFDAFSQITGQLFGKRKLAPAISPGKTIGGAIGGFIVCLLTAIMVADLMSRNLLWAIVFGIVTAVSSLSGDLLASWFKRKMKIKDYSNLLPGQGGFLDRYDSFIACGFVYYIALGYAA